MFQFHRIARTVIASAALAMVATLSSSCVSYQKYKATEQKLADATDYNHDLVKKYNLLLAKYEGLRNQKGLGGEASAKLASLETENQRLRQELGELKKKSGMQPAFTRQEVQTVGGEYEEGGMRLGENLLFREGRADLKGSAISVLNQLVDLLQTKYRDEMIIIEGHTDNQPLVSTKARWKDNSNLAYMRARTVFEFFRRHGIPESRMVVHSYSFNKPIDPATADTEEGKRKNRRVVVRRGGTPF